jgi:Glycosyl transferase family 2
MSEVSRTWPLVSILINNYNYGRFLGEAIDSALAQTYRNIEVIVVDDGSTDNSREVLAKYAGRVIAVQKENGGQPTAFNAGFAASKGDIICFLDADDLFLPEKIRTVVDVFHQNPFVAWCFDRVVQFDEQTGGRRVPASNWKSGPWDERDTMCDRGVAPNIPTATSGLSFRREMLARICPMPEFPIATDGYLKLVAVGLEQGWMAQEELTLQRIHGENVFTAKVGGKRALLGLTGILLGAALYDHVPQLKRLGITSFSRGLGICWVSEPIRPDYKSLAREFLRRVNLLTKARIYGQAIWAAARALLSTPEQRTQASQQSALEPLADLKA